MAAVLGVDRAVASTHGHEVRLGGASGRRQLLRRVGRGVDVVTSLADYTSGSPGWRARPRRRGPCPAGSTPTCSGPARAAGWCARGTGWPTDPSSSASRGWCPARARTCSYAPCRAVRRRVPDAALLLVGGGPALPTLRTARRVELGLAGRRGAHRVGAAGGAAGPLRRGRRLRDAVPGPLRRSRGRGPGHRVPGGVRDRPARRRRPVGGVAGHRPRRRHRATWSTAARSRRWRRALVALLSDPARGRGDGRRGARVDAERTGGWDRLAARMRAVLAGCSRAGQPAATTWTIRARTSGRFHSWRERASETAHSTRTGRATATGAHHDAAPGGLLEDAARRTRWRSASRTEARTSAPGGATASRGPSRSAWCGCRTDSERGTGRRRRRVHVRPLTTMPVSSAAVGVPGLRSDPATAATHHGREDRLGSARSPWRGRAAAGRGGARPANSAPDPSRQKALTPNSSPAPAATSPGSTISDSQGTAAPAAPMPGSTASTSPPRRRAGARQTLARSIATSSRSGPPGAAAAHVAGRTRVRAGVTRPAQRPAAGARAEHAARAAASRAGRWWSGSQRSTSSSRARRRQRVTTAPVGAGRAGSDRPRLRTTTSAVASSGGTGRAHHATAPGGLPQAHHRPGQGLARARCSAATKARS